MSIIKKLILNSEVYRLKKLRMKLETQINNYLKLQLKVMKDYASVVEDDELLGKKLIESESEKLKGKESTNFKSSKKLKQ